jgi:hypothetical protein
MTTIGFEPWAYVVGHRSRDSYLDEYISLDLNPVRDHMNESLTQEDKVLMIWEPRGYGCRIPHDADVLFDNFSQLLARYDSAEGVAVGLEEEGYSHVLVNQFIYPWIVDDYPMTAHEKASWEEFQERYLTEESLRYAQEGFLELHELPAEPGR